MIIHKLIRHYCRHGADRDFYRIQTRDAISWLKRKGVPIGRSLTVIDLGCGHGTFGEELERQGCTVTFLDLNNKLPAGVGGSRFIRRDIDREGLTELGAYDLVVCSNLFEHIATAKEFINDIDRIIRPGGHLYLSWTNWFSPWGGHDFSPFHYLGPRLGPFLWDKLVRRPRLLRPFENLFPVHIGRTLKWARANGALDVVAVAPRYYTNLEILLKVPGLREFAAWNCVILAKKRPLSSQSHRLEPT